MTKCNIIGKNEEIKATTTVEFSQSFMDMPKLTCRVLSAVPIAFEIDDYITFLGTKYYLDTLPNSKQNKGIGSSGDSLTYNLIFLGVERELDRYLMSDIVLSDNNVHYTSLTIFDAFCTPLTLIDRITANLNVINADYGFSNDNRWSIILPSDIAEIEADGKNLSFNNETLWNVLKRINDDFGLKFVTSGRKIYIYKTNYPFTSSETIFEYGKGKGLTEVSETFSESKIITRLKVYGGTTNLPLDYSNRLASDELRYTPNLMLPDYFESGGVIDYLEDKNAVAKFGIRYGSVTLDSIFPTIEKITFGDIDGSDSTTRIDEVYAVVNDAHVGNNSIFKIWVLFPFDLNEYSEVNQSRYFVQGTKVSFKDGLLGGYSFELLSVELVSEPNGYELTLGKIQNPDAGENNIAYLPDDVVKAQVGDHFILEGCFLPEVLVQAAQNRLRKEGLALLAEKSIAKPTFPISFDNIYLANNSKDADKLKCGATIRFTYPSSHGDFVIEDTIQQLSIKNGSGGLLQYSISLSNQPSLSKLGAIEKNYTRNLNLTTALKIESNRKYVQFGQEVASKASTEDFNKLKQLFDSMFELDSNNNAIKAKLSLYSVGAISAMGIGSGGSNSGGGVSYDRLDSWADYTSDKAGYVLSALLGYDLNTRLSSVKRDYATKDYVTTKLVDCAPLTSVQGFENRIGGLESAVPQLNERVSTVEGKVSSLNETVSTGENNLLDRVNAIETEYVTSGDLESAINGIDLSAYLLKADLTKSRIQSTLGISDWALAAIKPSYSWSEILSRPTALSQFTDDVGYATQSWVGDNYLSLSGGTVNGSIRADGGFNSFNTPLNTLPNALGSGINILRGNYADAGMENADISFWWTAVDIGYGNKVATSTDAGYRSQILVPNTKYHNRLFLRRGGDTNWLSTREFAFIDSNSFTPTSGTLTINGSITATSLIGELTGNADSATKLQTPCSLWGNKFDGTGDIWGSIHLGQHDLNVSDDTSTYRAMRLYPDYGFCIGSGTSGNYDTLLWGKNIRFLSANGLTRMYVQSDGKVGIDTNSPNVLLTVNGDLRAADSIYLHNTNEINSFQGKLYLNYRGSGLTGYGSTSDIVMVANGGNVSIGKVYAGSTAKLQIDTTATTNWAGVAEFLSDSLTDTHIQIGRSLTTKNSAFLAYHHTSANSNLNYTGIGFYGGGYLVKIFADGSIEIGGVKITASNGSITVNGNVLATGAITAKVVG